MPKPETDKVSGVIYFPLCARKEDPLLPLHNPHPFHFCLCLDVWNGEGIEGGQSKNTFLGYMLKNFKKGFNGDFGVKLTPDKLRTFCEIDWPTFGVGWP
jgi:hypothetical protein